MTYAALAITSRDVTLFRFSYPEGPVMRIALNYTDRTASMSRGNDEPSMMPFALALKLVLMKAEAIACLRGDIPVNVSSFRKWSTALDSAYSAVMGI